MAAFQQNPTILADSVLLPSYVPTIKTPGILNDLVPNLYDYTPFEITQKPLLIQNSSEGSSMDESSCLQQQFSSLTEEQRTESLLMADNSEGSEQVTQKTNKKRKSRKGSSSTSANSKDYIHVRARRGEATDKHSLAERTRRAKISERMKMLQALVPGCDKVIGKALILDEIISYVQSLQSQVQLLSLKLSSLDPLVKNFGCMEDDSMMFGIIQEVNADTALPMAQMQSTGDVQPQAFAEKIALSCSAAACNYSGSIVHSSVNLLQQDLKPGSLPLQDAGSLCWGINEQHRQSITNQFGSFSATNLYSMQ